jgi:hypothetical protein
VLDALRGLVCSALLIAVVVDGTAATAARAQGAEDPATTAPPPPAPPSSAPAEPVPFAGLAEPEILAQVRALEVRLSLGQELTPAETKSVVEGARRSPHVAVRALCAAVLAWLAPDVVADALVDATADAEPRVRAVAAQSLLSLGRRFSDEQRRQVVTTGLVLLDDPADEVACAAAELVNALSPSAATDAIRVRADAAGDVRYGCYSRIAGLPTRAVKVPPLPSLDENEGGDEEKPEVPAPAPAAPPQAPPDGTWLYVGTAAAAGFLSGALIPTGLVPARDVLTYTDDISRVTREEIALPTQLGAGLVAGALLGGGAYLLSTTVRPLNLDEASAVVLGTGALGLAGASSQLAFALREGPSSWTTAGALTLGLVASSGLAYGAHLDVDDEVLAASLMGIGALTTGLTVFTVVPVGLTQVGDALRNDFGLGMIGIGAGVIGFGGLATGAFVDVSRGRSFALAAGALLGGGAFTALGFVVTPESEVKSRIACGIGLAGELIGLAAAAFVPDAWLPSGLAVGSAVRLDGSRLALGVPVLEVTEDRAGQAALGATLVRARF